MGIILSACSSTQNIPTKNSEFETNYSQDTFTLSQKKLLEIIEEQKRFFSRASKKSKMAEAETASNARKLESLWEEYLARNPNDVEALILYGKFRRAVGDRENSYKIFQKADSLNPNLAVIKQQLCNHEAESGNYNSAYKNISKAVKLSPKNPVYWTQLAQLILVFREKMILDKSFTQDELDAQMLNAYAKALELQPNNLSAKKRYALCFYEVRKADWQMALSLWKEIENNSVFDFEKQTAKANQARILIELNKDQDAESLLKTITLPELSKDKETLLHIINKAKSSDKK